MWDGQFWPNIQVLYFGHSLLVEICCQVSWRSEEEVVDSLAQRNHKLCRCYCVLLSLEEDEEEVVDYLAQRNHKGTPYHYRPQIWVRRQYQS